MTVAALELDLEVFSGPFDLLLTLVLREEVDLLEVELADVVLTYLDHLEARGELDLEVATEFLVLIAALLELKSRLMLPREDEELLDLAPDEAAEELLARLLDATPLPARPPSTWPAGSPTRTAIASARRRCPPRCAASTRPRPARSTTPTGSARPSAALLRLPAAALAAPPDDPARDRRRAPRAPARAAAPRRAALRRRRRAAPTA